MANIRITVAVNGNSTPYFVPEGSTAASLAGNRTFKEDLGLGDNIRILVNGATTTGRIVSGDVLTVQTVASQKAANIRITVAVNGNSTPYFVPEGSTAASLAGNRTFKEDLGLGDNIRILVNGATTTGRIVSGDVLTVQTVASQKAN